MEARTTLRRSRPALKHGLTSRIPPEESSEEVEALADALLASSPREPRLLDAARQAAEARLHLRHIQSYRRTRLEECARDVTFRAPQGGFLIPHLPRECFEDHDAAASLYVTWRISVALEPLGDGSEDKVRDGSIVTGGALVNCEAELRRLADYERRAFSRWKKALRRLDYERVEAERRRAPNSGAQPRRARHA